MTVSRRAFLGLTGSVALAGCTGLASSGPNNCSPTGADVPTSSRDLPLPMAPEDLRSKARSGGPGKDGIPSIDDPTFVDAAAADHLEDDDIVFGLERNGEAKAYPQPILVHHEICNDTIAGEPVSVTYCPLTGTAMGFERGDTEFGVSGQLINNNLVMYDRGTAAWWPQILATSIPGPCNESTDTQTLREFRLAMTRWDDWRTHRPETQVLSEQTGFVREYNKDPYGSRGYYSSDSTLFPRLNADDRFHPKATVLGVRTPAGAVAFKADTLKNRGTMVGEIDGEPIVAVSDERLDSGYVYANPDEKTVAVDGEEAIVDGRAYAPDSLPLSRRYAFDAMWFAWIGFYPDSNVYA